MRYKMVFELPDFPEDFEYDRESAEGDLLTDATFAIEELGGKILETVKL